MTGHAVFPQEDYRFWKMIVIFSLKLNVKIKSMGV